jgi:hypothetical protein
MNPTPTILLVLLTVNLAGQSYMPVLSEDTVQWNYLSDTWCGDCLETLTFKCFDDTTIDGSTYKKLFKKHSFSNQDELWGFIKEDTSKSQLTFLTYAYECQDTPCIRNIIYDLNLEIGDTLTTRSYYNSVFNIVTHIDTIDNRKQIWFGNQGFGLIEGVGPTRELTIESYLTRGFSELLCKYHDNELVFSRRILEKDTCNIFLATTIEEQVEPEIVLYPNPVSKGQDIVIRGFEWQNAFVEIYTIRGVKVYHKKAAPSNSIKPIEFGASSGLYILRVIGPKHSMSKMFIMN